MNEVAELVAALIRNECVNDGAVTSGHEERSVATLQDFLGGGGDEYEGQPGRRSVVYRVAGRDTDAPGLMLMGHTDVVPANPATWSRDPFGGEVADGFVWGRGAVDMLNQTAAMAVVFKPYWIGAKEPLAGDLVYCAVADEEAGGAHGISYILGADPDAVRCDFVLTEIGMPHLPTADGPGMPVAVGEKGPMWTGLHAVGTPGHGSQPYRAHSAITPAAKAAALLSEAESPVEITDVWLAFLDAIDLPPDQKEALADPDRLDGAIAELAETDLGLARWVHACTHLTVAPNLMRAGVKSNIIPDAASLYIDVRALPGQDQSTADDHFRKVLGPALFEELDVEPSPTNFPPTVSPAEGPLWDALDAAHAELTSGRLIPSLIPVSTDARFFRHQGVVAYGAALFDDASSFSETLAMYHGNDERVSLGSLDLTVQLYDKTLERFSD